MTKSVYEEQYEHVQVGVAIVKLAARLWYERIPALVVFGGNSDCFQYSGKKAEVFDRRVNSVRRLAQGMLSVCLPHSTIRIVDGVKQLRPLRAHVVDGIGHYGVVEGIGTLDAYVAFTRVLAEFCMLAPVPRRSKL